jgi:hypothetical protein
LREKAGNDFSRQSDASFKSNEPDERKNNEPDARLSFDASCISGRGGVRRDAMRRKSKAQLETKAYARSVEIFG